MLCPDCKKKMNRKIINRTLYADFIECESVSEEVLLYSCKCGIKYCDLKWIIPDNKKPSEKQLKAAHFIERALNCRPPAPTKKALWNFINKYIDDAKNKIQKNNDSTPDDEESWYPTIFDFGNDDNLPF